MATSRSTSAENRRLVDRVDRGLVDRLGTRVAAHHDLDIRAFVHSATDGWPDRLVPRLAHIADALAAALPDDPLPVIQGVVADLPDEMSTDLGFEVWPITDLVGRQTDQPEHALATLRELGAKTYPELGVRPFLARDLLGTLAVLLHWTDDRRAGVRRLASEAARPRLPWASILRDLVADPAPAIPILKALIDDDDRLVRNSVANHLNDIAKDHPDLVVTLVTGWLEKPSEGRRWIATRALRTLTSRGHADALTALGLGPVAVAVEMFSVDPPRAVIGGTVTMTAVFSTTEAPSRRVTVEVAISYPRATGTVSRKVFAWWRGELAPHQRWSGTRRQHFRDLSTRTHHAGAHHAELLVNGRAVADATILLDAPGQSGV